MVTHLTMVGIARRKSFPDSLDFLRLLESISAPEGDLT